MLKKIILFAGLIGFPLMASQATVWKGVLASTTGVAQAGMGGYSMNLGSGTISIFNSTSIHTNEIIATTITASVIEGTIVNRATSTFSGRNSFTNGLFVATPTVSRPIFEVNPSSVDFTMNGSSLIVVTPLTVDIIGTSDGTNAPAGYRGEKISSATASGTNFGSNNQYGDIVTITLTPGRWIVNMNVEVATNTALMTDLQYGIGTATGNNSAGLTTGDTLISAPLLPLNGRSAGGSVAVYYNVTTNTPIYLKVFAAYSSGPPKGQGKLLAIRQ